MFRRDKTPLSGALHRLFQRCFQAPAPVRGWRDYVTGWGVSVKRIRAGEGIAASNPPSHRWRRAPPALDHATGQAVATSGRTRQQATRPDSSAAKGGAMGEPFSRPFPGRSIEGRGRAVVDIRPRAPGPGSVRAQHRARPPDRQNMGQGGQKKRGGLYVSE